MEPLKLCIIVLLLLAVRADSQICTVQEGRALTLNCTVPYRSDSLNNQFSWSKRVNGAVSTVASCDLDSYSCTPTPSTLPYTVTMTRLNASAATSNVTISSAARTDQGSWFCSGALLTQDVSACDLKVFAPPTNVSCSQPELHNNDVLVTCRGDRIYPQFFCQFTWIKNGVEQSTYNATTVKNQTFSQAQNTDYFYPECTWTIPVQTLGFGSHQFHVLIYPSVTGNTTTDMSYGRNSSLTSPVEINRPEVVLESCPQDYIKEGTTVSCTCREIKNSFLKANVNWSVSPGGSVVVTNQTFTTLTFTAQRNSSNYTCRAEVIQVWSENKTCVPQVAYGPDRVEMKVQINGYDKTDIDLCGKTPTSQTMTVSCTVSDVRPSATVKYFINGNVKTDGSAGSVNYTITGGGNLPVKCAANNYIFPDISKENTTSLLVREPPNTPFLKVEQLNLISSTSKDQQQQQLTVREGLVRILCQVDRGYPNITQLALNCNNSTNTATVNTVSIQMNVTRKINSQLCSCTATHPSTCYMNNNTTSTFNVLYPPTIINFTVLNEVVQDNTNVMFSCKAEGNPAPSLTLLRDSDSQILEQTDNNNKAILQLNKTVTCQDSDIYMCKTQSSEGEGREKIKIYVSCTQQLAPTESQDRVYSMKANETFDINITVIGYPEPQQLSLHSSNPLHKNEYSLTYYNTTPGKGVINLKIYTLLEDYYQKYNLNIENTQGSFVYSFEIKAENANNGGGSSDIGAIIGGIAAGIVAIILVALVVFLLKRKRKSQNKTKSKKKDSDLITIDNSDIYNSRPNDGGVVLVDNADIYNMGREVVIDNSDIYNMSKSNETVIDNSDIYNMSRDNTVVIDNSDIYNMDRKNAADGRASTYRNYSDITTTMTSATAMPKNMKPVPEEPILDNPYEDVEKASKSSAPKVQQKPQVAVKPKQAMKPNQGKASPANTAAADNKREFQLNDNDANQTYAVINKIPKSDTPKQKVLKKPSIDDGFPDQSQTPIIPEKKYEKADKEKKNGKMKEKGTDKNMKGTSSEDTSHVYTNKGYSNDGDDVNVYANT